jgi:hypothetical protein
MLILVDTTMVQIGLLVFRGCTSSLDHLSCDFKSLVGDEAKNLWLELYSLILIIILILCLLT